MTAMGHKQISHRHLGSVRFTPQSGHRELASTRPFSARTGRERLQQHAWANHERCRRFDSLEAAVRALAPISLSLSLISLSYHSLWPKTVSALLRASPVQGGRGMTKPKQTMVPRRAAGLLALFGVCLEPNTSRSTHRRQP